MSEERYEIIKLLGKGRTGGVYEAEDTRLGRKVAMRRFFSQSELTDVSEYVDDFLNISQSLSALQHPNLLRVFDAGTDEDGAFIISQMMKGDTLHNRLKEGPLSSWDVWDLGHQMLDALSTAHMGGFVHGAITPGSILMSPRARGGFLYVILDMGLCRLAPLIQGKDSILSMMADPAILAPELFDGSEATEKADLYMLGNILYMCLAGGHPFAGKSLEECSKLHSAGLPLLKEFAPDAPDDFVAWIAELCEVNAHDRPHSVVTALRTMPKVEKPAGARATGIHGTPTTMTAPVALAAPSTLGNPGVAPTGAGVAGTASTLGQAGVNTPAPNNTFQQPQKSNKVLYIVLGVIAVLGVALYFMIAGDKKTGAEIAAENAKKNQQGDTKSASPSNNNSNKTAPKPPVKRKKPSEAPKASGADTAQEVVISLDLKKKGSPASRGWKISGKKHQKMTLNGWSIKGAKGANPTIAKRITATDLEDMFKRGWTMKYVVFAREGAHVIGMKISADENEYWMNTGKSASFYFGLINQGDDLTLTQQSTGLKVNIVGGGKTPITFEFKGKAGDRTGSYGLYVNGKHVAAFKGKLEQGDNFTSFFSDTLFSSSGNSTASGANWIIQELSLSVGSE